MKRILAVVISFILLGLFSYLFLTAQNATDEIASSPAVLLSKPALVDAVVDASAIPNGYLARIQLNSPDEVYEILQRAEALYDSVDKRPSNPLELVLHGPEVAIFIRDNYEQYNEIVDLAEQLIRRGVVGVTVCETRLGAEGVSGDEVQPFVESVPFGPAEVRRLLNDEGYVYF